MIIISQPGRGKSKVRTKLEKEFADHGGVAVVDTDVFRECHPEYETIVNNHGEQMAELTHPDAHLWKDEAISWLMEHRANMIIEDTCKDPQEMVAMVRAFRQAGYSVEVHALAVSESESRVGIIERFADQLEKHGYGRIVPVERHDQSYESIPVALQRLESENLVDYLAVYDRNEKMHYTNMLDERGNLVGAANSEMEINKHRNAELGYTETIAHMQTLDRLQQSLPQVHWQRDIAQVRVMVTKQANPSALNRCSMAAAFPRLVDPSARTHAAPAKSNPNASLELRKQQAVEVGA